ncbi:MAG: hypothetical protein ACOYMN_11455 [Roseimicrobium sp.]
MYADAPPSAAVALPSRPRLVLRVAFAGNRELPVGGMPEIEASLRKVWGVLGKRLAEIAPGMPQRGQDVLPVTEFFSFEKPVLRLVSGLAEGADTLAWQSLNAAVADSAQTFMRDLDVELAGVLPCTFDDYLKGRDTVHQPQLLAQAAACAYIVELDGKLEKPSEDTPLAMERRARGYRAQSTLLTRQADILVAVANPKAGKAGGTMETVRKALAFDMPVVFIHSGVVADKTTGAQEDASLSGEVRLLDPDADFEGAYSGAAPEDWAKTLEDRITVLVADADTGSKGSSRKDDRLEENEGGELLREFFEDTTTPPIDAKGERKQTTLEKWWTWFSDKFKPRPEVKPEKSKSAKKPDPTPFGPWRKRATNLNYHYTGLYRGTFFVNFVRAVLAVACAALTLTLLVQFAAAGSGKVSAHTDNPHSPALLDAPPAPAHVAESVHTPAPVAEGKTPELATAAGQGMESKKADTSPHAGHALDDTSVHLLWWQVLILLIIALIKLRLVWMIDRSTHKANHQRFNDKAVDYRYLAECLRSMLHLPHAGSFLPPAVSSPQYASRVVRQSAVDWLFDSIVRCTSPAASPWAVTRTFALLDGAERKVPILKIDALGALESLRTWVASQIQYHNGNRAQMHAMHRWARSLGGMMGKVVIVIVIIDIVALGVYASHLSPRVSGMIHEAAPWLVLLTALLPAAMASLNGIRFQSECHRLSDRSSFMLRLLNGNRDKDGRITEVGRLQQIEKLKGMIEVARASPQTDPGAWSGEALHQCELVARDFAQEAAEWTVLYGKEVHEQ